MQPLTDNAPQRPPTEHTSPPSHAPFYFTAATALGTLWILLYPFHFRADPVSAWLSSTWVGKIDATTNVILFIPLGIVAAWHAATARPNRPAWQHAAAAVLIGAVASLLAETVQVWLDERQSALIDLATNCTGTLLGALIGTRAAPLVHPRLGRPHPLARHTPPRPTRHRRRRRRARHPHRPFRPLARKVLPPHGAL